MKLLKLIIVLSSLFASIHTQLLPVPQQDIQLLEGVFQGLDLTSLLGLQSCRETFNEILEKSQTALNAFANNNKTEAYSELSVIFTDLVKIYQTCPEIEANYNALKVFGNKAYNFPGKFLYAGLNNLVGFSSIKKLWNLLSELKKEDLTEAGITLGEIAKGFVDSKFSDNKSLSFLGIPNDACLDILEKIKKDLQTMISSLFSDIKKVKEALDDFFVQVKTIPSVCI